MMELLIGFAIGVCIFAMAALAALTVIIIVRGK